MEPQREPQRARRERWRRSVAQREGAKSDSGQAIVEFAIVSVAFFLMVFGTIDLGRAIYMYSQLHNAVREGARYGKVHLQDSPPKTTTDIKNKVISQSNGVNISASNITVSCTGGCGSSATDVTVVATTSFSAITKGFLGLPSITLKSSATDGIE